MIIADTTPLSVFIRIGRTDLLTSIFPEILIPAAVAAELDRGHPVIGDWRTLLPQVTVHALPSSALLKMLRHELDPGESEAIVLALDRSGSILLIDEARGRQVARRMGVNILGSVGLVLLAKEQGMVSAARPVLDELRGKGGLWLSENFYHSVLRDVGE